MPAPEENTLILGTSIYKPFKGHLEGEQCDPWGKLLMVIHHVSKSWHDPPSVGFHQHILLPSIGLQPTNQPTHRCLPLPLNRVFGHMALRGCYYHGTRDEVGGSWGGRNPRGVCGVDRGGTW